MTTQYPPPMERLLAKVEVIGECWIWTGAKSDQGYGNFRADGQVALVHRFAYEQWVGPIPEGLEVDHQCHNNDPTCPSDPTCIHRHCVNPDHLELATHADNWRRGRSLAALAPHQFQPRSYCQRGHALTADNIFIEGDGRRRCRACRRLRYDQRRAAAGKTSRKAS